ncbi:5' nucleotidase, NT5C type [Spongiibacter sp. UBA1325]|jgi:hypothetical protein|uniref:5' nucleotidase, NT5C type n=1 Tax=Spongiibacter sp. UBA1325 TaxID=1947543 RepID=UPI00257A4F5C|nr:hypothetical protein [Spongiibacter sp. UBA1325]|tara:strand:+ start:3014 stop:3523 length:510 start_codon:yes stop_codon:yes gene_type:complete
MPKVPAQRSDTRHFNPKHRRIFVDMDDTLCDFAGHYRAVQAQRPDLMYPQSLPGFFIDLPPLLGAIEAFHHLSRLPNTEVYILTAPSVMNPHSYTEKRQWVASHLGIDAAYRLIICPNKGLIQGDYLIDDRPAGKGQEHFNGELVLFGSPEYPDWSSVLFHRDFGLFSE